MARTVEAGFNELILRQALTANQVSVTQARVAALKTFFAKNLAMAEEAFTTGSYARGTICAGQRDIDMMAPLAYEYWERYQNRSRDFLYMVRDKLNTGYATTNVSSRQVAVTLDFTAIAADVVPCFKRQGTGYVMPNGNGGWMATNPREHTLRVENADAAHNGRLKPLIRLMKAWNRANGNHLRSFHVEMLVMKMWENLEVGSWSHAVKATLEVMASWLKTPTYDPWKSDIRIDSYLSDSDRALVMRMANEDASCAAEAEKLRAQERISAAFERWSVVYRLTFPAYG